jgi:hypothetical protein
VRVVSLERGREPAFFLSHEKVVNARSLDSLRAVAPPSSLGMTGGESTEW